MTGFWAKIAGSGSNKSEPLDANDAVQFWQREAYYYEGRAGEQGASANRMVTLAAGATAVLPLVANVLGSSAVKVNPDLQLLLLIVPVVLFVLWSSAVRLLHEMHLLRVYVRRAEAELEKLAKTQPTLVAYTRWADHGGKHDFTYFSMLVWFVAALALSLAGAFGITYAVVISTHPEFVWIAIAAPLNAFIILIFSFTDALRDVRQIEWQLGLTPKPVVHATRTWLDVIGIVGASALVVAGPVAAAVLIHDNASRGYVLTVLAVFTVAITIAGTVSGWFGRRSLDTSVARRASKTLVFVGLFGSLFVIVASSLGWLGL